MSTLADHWSALATAALLGTDRRPLPHPPDGPLAEIAVERAGAAPPERLLDAVALLGAMRRAGLVPSEPAAALPLLSVDERPECPAVAVHRLQQLLLDWPQLVGEWVEAVRDNGWALPPDVVVLLLTRRGVPAEVRSAVVAHADPLVAWLGAVLPADFGPKRIRARTAATDSGAGAVLPAGAAGTATAQVPLPAKLQWGDVEGETVHEYAARFAHALRTAAVKHMHRPALVRLVSALPLVIMLPLVDALSRAATHPETMGLVASISELAQFRWDLHEELLP